MTDEFITQRMRELAPVTALDTLRADTMQSLLNERGRQEIWRYDVCERRVAARLAIDDQNYDNMRAAADAGRAGHLYALTGPGIEDHHFTTPAELVALVRWLCIDSYLSCYANTTREGGDQEPAPARGTDSGD